MVAFAPRYNNGLCWAVRFALTDSKWRFCPKAACAAIHGQSSRSPSCKGNASVRTELWNTCKKRYALLSVKFIKMSQAWFKPLVRHICDPYFAGLFFPFPTVAYSVFLFDLGITWQQFGTIYLKIVHSTFHSHRCGQRYRTNDKKHDNNNNSMVIGHKITVSHKKAVLAIQYFNDKIMILNEKDT